MTRNLVPWDVRFAPALNFERDMRQLLGTLFGENGGGGTTTTFSPRLNLAETEAAFEVCLEIPGLKPDDFTLELKEGELWISGKKEQVHEEKGKTYHCRETSYGEFRRVVPLSTAVDADNVEAEYKDGILHVIVPKAEAVKPKQIKIKT